MNFNGSIPGSANFRNRGNSNQSSPFSANLCVYASLYEKISLGAYYSRLRNIKMGTIIRRGLAVFVSVGCASRPWEYLYFIMCRNRWWHSGLLDPFLVCICPQKNPTHREAGSGVGYISSVHECVHLAVMFPSVWSQLEPTDIHKMNPEMETYHAGFRQRQKPDVGERWWASIWCGRAVVDCFLCSGWFIW